jgi:hypothetical protein
MESITVTVKFENKEVIVSKTKEKIEIQVQGVKLKEFKNIDSKIAKIIYSIMKLLNDL